MKTRGLLEVSEALLLTHPPAACFFINPHHDPALMQWF
jgi:hypothetical protein